MANPHWYLSRRGAHLLRRDAGGYAVTFPKHPTPQAEAIFEQKLRAAFQLIEAEEYQRLVKELAAGDIRYEDRIRALRPRVAAPREAARLPQSLCRRAMILLIDPPVTAWSPPDDIRAWMRELDAMRAQHAGDHEALGCIARAEEHATSMLELSERLPPIEPPRE